MADIYGGIHGGYHGGCLFVFEAIAFCDLPWWNNSAELGSYRHSRSTLFFLEIQFGSILAKALSAAVRKWNPSIFFVRSGSDASFEHVSNGELLVTNSDFRSFSNQFETSYLQISIYLFFFLEISLWISKTPHIKRSLARMNSLPKYPRAHTWSV